jgi:hypothetical protein
MPPKWPLPVSAVPARVSKRWSWAFPCSMHASIQLPSSLLILLFFLFDFVMDKYGSVVFVVDRCALGRTIRPYSAP